MGHFLKCFISALAILTAGISLLISFSPSPEEANTTAGTSNPASAEAENGVKDGVENSTSTEEEGLSPWDKEKIRDWTAELLRARLIEAILEQDPRRVRELLAEGADPLDRRRANSPRGGRYGRSLSTSPLLYAVGYAHHERLRREVLAGGFQIFGYKVEGPFKPSRRFNAEAGAEIVRTLIESGADPDKAPFGAPVRRYVKLRDVPVPQQVIRAVEETAQGEYREPEWALEVEENLEHVKGLWEKYATPVNPDEFPS